MHPPRRMGGSRVLPTPLLDHGHCTPRCFSRHSLEKGSAVSALKPEMLSIREFARRDGCDESRVRRGIKTGHLKRLADGKLDAALVGTGWRETNRRNAGRADPADPADLSRADSAVAADPPRTPGTVRTPEVLPADTQTPYVAHPLGLVSEVISTMAVVLDGFAMDAAQLLLPHLPRKTIAPIVDEMITRARRAAVEILHDDFIDPPDEFESWADHPWFSTPLMSEAAWEEAANEAELAAASVQAGGAAPDA